MPRPPKKTSQAYEKIKKRVFEGGYPPGEFLTEEQLKADLLRDGLEVSATTIRRALEKLETDKLIERSANTGVQVCDRPWLYGKEKAPANSEDKAILLLKQRAAIEEWAAVHLAERGADISDVRVINLQMKEIAKANSENELPEEAPDRKRFVSLDRQLHCKIAELAFGAPSSDWLQEIRKELEKIATVNIHHNELNDVVLEHEQILSAIEPAPNVSSPDRPGHTFAARQAVRLHLRNATQRWKLVDNMKKLKDIPSIYESAPERTRDPCVESEKLRSLRKEIEDLAIRELCSSPEVNLRTIELLHGQMQTIANRSERTERDEKDFVSFDFHVHSTLSWLAYGDFLTQALQQIWERTRKVIKLGIRRDENFQKVVEEHAAFLEAIREAQRMRKEQLVCEREASNKTPGKANRKLATARKAFEKATENAVRLLNYHLDTAQARNYKLALESN